ncbi:MAG: ABC transporter ATP-binding protein [Thermoguttaceae bacterium]|jgi:ATP-binding cassette subfamily B protein/subfamily B ATP-binding cassette protein MsbA
MTNFNRVIRMAFQYRVTLVGALISALAVAVLWGGNVGAVYPFVQVALLGESLQQWVDGEIKKAHDTAAEKTAEVAQLQQNLARAAAGEQAPLQAKIRAAQSRIAAEQQAERSYTRVKPYVDRYLPHDPFLTLALVTLALILGTLLKDLFLIANNVLVARLAQLATFDLRKLFYRRTLRLDLAVFSNEGTSDLMSRFTHDTANVASGLEALFGKLIGEPLKMLACLIGAAWVCWRLLLLSLVVAPLAGLAIRWLSKMLKRSNRRAMEQMAQLYGTLEETFRGIKIVKAFTNEPHERKRFHLRSKEYYKKAMKIARYDSLSHPITEIMGIMSICLAFLAGTWLVLKGQTHLFGIRMTARPIDLGSLLLFYGFLAASADPMRKFSDVFSRLQSAMAASDRIFERLDRQPQVRNAAAPVSLKRHQRELAFDRVGFAYQPGSAVLEQISLEIPFGEALALVGANGSGKTTLANLIPRFADPTSGVIRLDGTPLTQLRLRELRGQIGIVTQEPLLFDDTVLNNIRYGRRQASREEIVEAAKRAHAHRFIESELPNGYETVVGTLGGRLSGGQRQRIALARAILRDPAILILDEATSQIDLESEQAIQQVLETFIRNRTTILITHRLSTLALANRIVVMQAGRIVDVGKHEEMLNRCALYRRLYQIQFEDLKRSA